MRVTIDSIDVTEALNRQHPLPENPGGILPNSDKGWYDLLRVISSNQTLKNNFFKGNMHRMQIIDDSGRQFDVKVIVRAKYSALNR